jgi:hypothetical protein
VQRVSVDEDGADVRRGLPRSPTERACTTFRAVPRHPHTIRGVARRMDEPA